jgi:hypothetical protein
MRILVITLAALVLSACAEYIDPNEYEKAREVCKNNEGIKSVGVNGAGIWIYCNNGAEFFYNKKELK